MLIVILNNIMISVNKPNDVMLSVIMLKYHYTECHNAECRFLL